ncbi:hypothetical protein B4065_0128 [Caldibacillus thermoamylovorans]|uniref:hypothetical protein n=1 Tax=Bacillaceae TaxID=186817 RepID=UPI0005A47952|nr:hypothetical protein [Caldibacillus thermoamylovorans]KIO60202.1 hypothetical protein B4065_0128 [Caldibacillus thermoamylovorans]
MSNEIATHETFKTGLAKVSDTFYPMIEQQLTGNGIRMDDYQKTCVMNAIAAINNVLDTKGISWNSPDLDRNNITDILLKVAALKLNASASPREVYFQLRNVKLAVPNPSGGKPIDKWVKQIEMGIEGDGNDAILANFGRDVKTVHNYWLVRENDEFEYPMYNGIEVTPPKWRPTGKGKVVRVVYPIEKSNGNIEYLISEREDVIKNLIAHVNNNLTNETFGIAKDRYNATPEQKKKINAKKKEIIDKIESLGLEKALDEESLADYISPAWREKQSRESMIIRKMRNNVTKKYTKDFGNAFVSMTYDEATDEDYKRVRKEINENANSEVLDFEEVPTIEQPKAEVIDYGPVNEEQEELTSDKASEPEQMTFEATGTEGPGF